MRVRFGTYEMLTVAINGLIEVDLLGAIGHVLILDRMQSQYPATDSYSSFILQVYACLIQGTRKY